MKKAVLFLVIFTVFAIVSFCVFASSEPVEAKLTGLYIVGPNAVSEDTQNIYSVIAEYDNGSKIDVTADANFNAVSDECKVINIGGIVETFKLEKPEKQFTIHANYRDFKVEKSVIIIGKNRCK